VFVFPFFFVGGVAGGGGGGGGGEELWQASLVLVAKCTQLDPNIRSVL